MKQTIMICLVVITLLLSTVGKSAYGQNKAPQTTTTAVNSASDQLIGPKWKLFELHGQAVVKNAKGKDDSYIRFTKEGTISAYTGCNNMTGSYQVYKGSGIKFSNIASTRMACPDMKTEQILNQVLQTADNFSVKAKRLTLSKTGQKPLAVFVAEEGK
jgi:copper homeostasis protein (lipoprotein)